MLNFEDKLHLIRLLLDGNEHEAARQGFCDRERSEIRMGLILHGYLEAVAPQNEEEELLTEELGSRYRMTEEGRKFLERLARRE
jgi:hypothetical protein